MNVFTPNMTAVMPRLFRGKPVEAYEQQHSPIEAPDHKMIRRLSHVFGLPATVMIQDHPLRREAA
jgi:hypothetical protein